MSQELRYYDQNNVLIVKAHRYLRPDGGIAASGRIDPKRVAIDNVKYILDETIREEEPLPDVDPQN